MQNIFRPSNYSPMGLFVIILYLITNHSEILPRFSHCFVGREGVEPSRCHHRRILSPLRLPIPPSPHGISYSTLIIRSVKRTGIVHFDRLPSTGSGNGEWSSTG